MNIIEVGFDNWHSIAISINWIAFVALCGLVMIFTYIVHKTKAFVGQGTLQINEASLGIGNSNIKLKFDMRDQEVAYKLWVELSTRKIGLEFDEENDVIDEVYNSWYSFFGIARELLKEVPVEKLRHSGELVDLTQRVLNEGLRPHLTKWQAKYRKWYESEKHNVGTPQEIQKTFNEYNELVNDLKVANKRMIEYMQYMHKIAFSEK